MAKHSKKILGLSLIFVLSSCSTPSSKAVSSQETSTETSIISSIETSEELSLSSESESILPSETEESESEESESEIVSETETISEKESSEVIESSEEEITLTSESEKESSEISESSESLESSESEETQTEPIVSESDIEESSYSYEDSSESEQYSESEESSEIEESSEFITGEDSSEEESESITSGEEIWHEPKNFVRYSDKDDLADLEKVLLVNRSVGSALTTQNKGSLEYYKLGYSVDINNYVIENLPDDLTYWVLERIDDTYFAVRTYGEDFLYLQGIRSPKSSGSGYYYNIYTVETFDNYCKWQLIENDGGYYLKSSDSVYLEYYNGSFCGYSQATSACITDIYGLEEGYWYIPTFDSSESVTDTSSEKSPVDDYYTGGKEYWESLSFSNYGNTFRSSLASLINQTGTRTSSYKGLNAILEESDASTTDPNKMVPFYHSQKDAVTPVWSNSGFNKEHTWPDSRGAGKSGPGSDPQIIRPTLAKDNSSRGNKMFGTVSGAFDPLIITSETAEFDDYPECRGEAARIIFYAAVKYKESKGFELTNNAGDAASKNTMGVLKELIKWNNEYPVTELEIARNNRLHEMGFSRNPFIDNREFVNYIWDINGVRTSAY
ncbi:MAG: endonuclease [Bacilli bacterium]|nr:endonuclease [Bacilli bacterium]